MSSNQYEAEQETKQQSHNNAVRELAKSRSRLKEALTMAEIDGVPPYQCVINPTPPDPNDISGGQPRPMWSEALRSCHAATLELWDEVRPYSHNVAELWKKDLEVVRIPVEGEWTTRARRHRGSVKRRELDYKPVRVTLDSLGYWRFHQVTLAVKTPEEGQTRGEKVYLPPIACHQAKQTLDTSLEEIGLLAEVREREARDSDPGVPDDIDAWGQYEQE